VLVLGEVLATEEATTTAAFYGQEVEALALGERAVRAKVREFHRRNKGKLAIADSVLI